MTTTKILIADDHKIVRIGLKAVLDYERDFTVVGEAIDGEQAVSEAIRLQPDVVIMDLVMPKKDGVQATIEICKRLPNTKVMLLTTFGTSDGIAHALEAGAKGAMMKTADDTKIIAAIRTIARGEQYISPDVQRQLSENPPIPQLSQRQTEMLHAIGRGETNKQISVRMGIRLDSVEAIAKTLYAKLGAANRAEAVAIALRKHLLKI